MDFWDIFSKVLMTTYTIVLPLGLKWLANYHKEKKSATKYMRDSVMAIEDSVNALAEKVDYNEAMTSRYRIIRAADEVRRGEKLSQDSLDQLGEDIEIYRAYCDSHPSYKNHKGKSSMDLIEKYEDKKDEQALKGE